MEFADLLNEYIDKINCTSKELSNESGISPSLISRYRNGQRIPKYNSKQYINLIKGLSTLSNIDKENITKDFNNLFKKENIDFNIFINNLNIIIEKLNINSSELSKYIGFDSSYISKIKNGTRKPHNIDKFIMSICKYITHKCNTESDINKILSNNLIYDEIQILSENEFNEKNYTLSLSDLFLDKEIYYTYEQYLEHINCIKKFKNKNYKYIINNNIIFQNINIHIIENKQVIISKENLPSIQFIITNNKLVNAIENIN